MTIKIKVQKLEHFDENYPLPKYETEQAAGADLRAMIKEGQTVLKPGERKLIPLGLKMEIPKGFQVAIRPRSGLSLKSDLLVVNSPGTIDADYRGEVCVILGNFGKQDIIIQHGDRIAQMVVEKVYQADFQLSEDLSETARGEGGFGSTGS